MAAGSVIRSVLQPVLRQSVRQNLWSSSWNPQNYWYGIEFDVTATSPAVTRIAEDDLVKMHTVASGLPIHSLMKGCLLKADGSVNYYLNPTDWTKKLDGSDSVLDGTDGNVMIEIPAFYEKYEIDGDTRRVKISSTAKDGFSYVQKQYIGAYRTSLNRTTLKSASVINATTAYRGGNNNDAYDAGDNTLLGKPATNLGLTNHRVYAENISKGYCVLPYYLQTRLYWLYVIEYANRNVQLAFNASLTAEGYRQGGLGLGVTNLDTTEWNTYNARNPVVPNGQSNLLGNNSGEVSYEIPGYIGTNTVKIARYRGIENIFGELINLVDGINVNHTQNTDTLAYIVDDYSKFAVSEGTTTNSRDAVSIYAGGGADANIKTINFGTKGDILPASMGGTNAQYFTDVYWSAQNNAGGANGWKVCAISDNAYEGLTTGLSSFHAWLTNVSAVRPDVGTRLAYAEIIPQIVSTEIANATPTQIKINFNRPIFATLPAVGDFAIAGKTISGISATTYQLVLTLSAPIAGGELVILSYTQPATNRLKGIEASTDVASFSQQITNNVAFTNSFKTDGGTKGWYVFDDDTTIIARQSNNVSTWKDKLGSGRDLLQATTTKQPVISSDGVYFNGAKSMEAAFDWNRPEWIYMVVKQKTWAANDIIFDGNTNGYGTLTQNASTPGLKASAGDTHAGQNDNLALDTWGIVRVRFKTGAGNCKFQINATAALTGNWAYFDMDGFVIGSRKGGALNLSDIVVREIILRSSDDNTTVEAEIYDYLAAKYGI